MAYFISELIIVIILLSIASVPGLLVVAVIVKIWFAIREKNMKKLANEYNLKFKSNPLSFKQCIYSVIWSYALREDWKTNFIEGIINKNKILICDNLFSGPRILGKPLNSNARRTIIQINDKDMSGKEFRTQFSKFQDGALTSVWELRRILKNI
ncbi:MAG: hypothetical protein COX29_00970 [Candidatus Moranbacteria bacterium CG23_combo_of_CG06-09_8_20_14_all_35_22]|nr:MAG: hypothetical protein COX29_00970 [Candidatus Moranbacteria bacterium CG23_combo_of_CG06-09_8_20_14_all_35_22]